jgi:hypothetical protein
MHSGHRSPGRRAPTEVIPDGLPPLQTRASVPGRVRFLCTQVPGVASRRAWY